MRWESNEVKELGKWEMEEKKSGVFLGFVASGSPRQPTIPGNAYFGSEHKVSKVSLTRFSLKVSLSASQPFLGIVTLAQSTKQAKLVRRDFQKKCSTNE